MAIIQVLAAGGDLNLPRGDWMSKPDTQNAIYMYLVETQPACSQCSDKKIVLN